MDSTNHVCSVDYNPINFLEIQYNSIFERDMQFLLVILWEAQILKRSNVFIIRIIYIKFSKQMN